MSRGPDAGTLLRRALERDAHRADCTLSITDTQMTRWASATFVGARHRLTFDAKDDAMLSGWLDALSDADLPMHAHLVADITIAAIARDAGGATVVLEALTVEIS